MLSGESRFFEESINAGKLKDLLNGRSGKSGDAVQDRLQGMKWLLAMVSKGRDVSQFYPDVVKNVVVKSVELKKLVYVFLMHYTDHDASCREMALLSINSFQKDLTDINPLIRALALRTMTSIRVLAIVQLQLLAAQKCSSDISVYVRKIAAHALPKIYSIDPSTKEELVKLLRRLLSDQSTMVVGSAVAAFNEICPSNFEVIHPVFRRLCTSLVDLDEWSQTLTMSVLGRYARRFFARPQIEIQVESHTTDSTADLASAINQNISMNGGGSTSRNSGHTSVRGKQGSTEFGVGVGTSNGIYARNGQSLYESSNALQSDSPARQLPTCNDLQSFYADEDSSGDESTDKGETSTGGNYLDSASGNVAVKDTAQSSLSQAQRGGYKEFTSGSGRGDDRQAHSFRADNRLQSALEVDQVDASTASIGQGTPMEPDHKLLLKSCIPLLHSRNSGVVLAVVSVLWHCGRKSAAAMQSCASALVRLVRSHREVQYIALNAMMPIVVESPWYFRPYLRDFFVEAATDARFVRFLKVDILALLLCDINCDQILAELEVYLAHPDKVFVCYVVQVVGRVVTDRPQLVERCLRGLMTLMTSPDKEVVAEAVVVTRTLLQQHPSHPAIVRRLVRMLDQTKRPFARASVVWISAEFLEYVPEIAPDILRRLALSFEEESLVVKMQAVNLAVRLHLILNRGDFVAIFGQAKNAEVKATVNKLMSYVLELARFDPDYDLRDRIRFLDAILSDQNSFSAAQREQILLCSKPPPSVKKSESKFAHDPTARFAIDSLSHCVGHAAFGNQPLLDWPTIVPDLHLRDSPSSSSSSAQSTSLGARGYSGKASTDFYGDEETNDSSDSDSESGDSGRSSMSAADVPGDSSSDSSSSDSGGSDSDSDSSSSSSNEEAMEGQSSSDTGSDSDSSLSSDVNDPLPPSPAMASQLLNLSSMVADESTVQVSTNEEHDNALLSLQAMSLCATEAGPKHALQFKTLLSNVHGDGLNVDAAFARPNSVVTLPSACASFSKQDISNMSTIILRITNKLSSQNLASIKITNLKLGPGQSLIPFDPITSVSVGATTQTAIMVDFASKPNTPVRFSFSTERGTFPVSLEAPCGELLRPAPQLLLDGPFAAQSARLGGMHEASQSLAEGSGAATRLEALTMQGKRALVAQATDLACSIVSDTELRAAGVKLGSPSTVVLLIITPSLIKVCCDDAIFGRLLLNEVYNAL